MTTENADETSPEPRGMHLLVTAGNTQTPIDQVRCITNVFSGRTGAGIALTAWRRGHRVTLLTSRPEAVASLGLPTPEPLDPRWRVQSYRTFDDLHQLLAHHLGQIGGYHAVIHCAAVSDYAITGVYAGQPTTGWRDASAAKIRSHHAELWLRLSPTPKLIDQMRAPWGFRGVLVKFKLEVGVSAEELTLLAEPARLQSQADLLVANTLEGMGTWALLGPIAGSYERLSRADLPERLLSEVERLAASRG